jgi:hypothetical protein
MWEASICLSLKEHGHWKIFWKDIKPQAVSAPSGGFWGGFLASPLPLPWSS